jgi:acyl-CoA hydrolase/RimJ/RimL family protein N-acetyltransferase
MISMPNDSIADKYQSKITSAKEAIRTIKSGQRIFIGSSCGEPQHLVNTLMDNALIFSDVEIVRLLSLEGSLLALMANENEGRNFNVRSIYQGSGQITGLKANKRYITPVNLSAVPNLFKQHQLPLHVALIQVAPPDEYGYMSLGISVDVTLSAAQSADIVIAQVNPRMPKVPGHGFIHLDEVDIIVEHEEELLSVFELPEYPQADHIARVTASLIKDGSTVQMGLGILSRAIAQALAEKNDLGVHTEFLTDDLMELAQQGVITNRFKGINEGKLVAGGAIGTQALYDFLNENPAIEFRPSDYVNNPTVIGKHQKMVAVNVAQSIDLTGQVSADALPQNHFSGVTGMLDFIIGASMSPTGRSIIVIPATNKDATASRIISEQDSGSIVIPKGYVSYVVSEYGMVNLFGKNIQERAMAMIGLAHPDFRDELFQQAKESGLVEKERTLKESLFGIYPTRMEEIIERNGQQITLRPTKTVDERRIQEHFYNMDQADVTSRFFGFRRSFYRKDVEGIAQVDYIKNLSIVAVIGEIGFEKVIGLAEYNLEHGTVAEVAFTVSKDWQGKGIASVLLKKMAEAARENGITQLVAYVLPTNKSMINLFKKLPYKIKTRFEDDMLVLTCDFEQPLINPPSAK